MTAGSTRATRSIMIAAENVLIYLAVILSAVIMSCLVSTMIIFMGGGQASVDISGLIAIQIASVPAALISAILAIQICKTAGKEPLTIGRLYHAVPQWLVFICLILFLLVCFGEIAFLIVSRTTNIVVGWAAHAPLISMFACSVAVCILYGCIGLLRGKPHALSGRWSA